MENVDEIALASDKSRFDKESRRHLHINVICKDHPSAKSSCYSEQTNLSGIPNLHITVYSLIPAKSFFTKISPSLISGTGNSVLYKSLSAPPVSSRRIPRIVLGIVVDDMVRCRIEVRVKGDL